MWTTEEWTEFWKWYGTYSGYRVGLFRKFTTRATDALCVERNQCARLRLYWYNGQYAYL